MSTEDALEMLSSYELPELVYQALSFLNVPVGALEHDNSAIAASYAIRKVEHYLSAVQSAEDRRREHGLDIGRELAAAEALRADDPKEAERQKQAALYRMGEYEIEQHHFTVDVGQIRRLLCIAHRLVGVELPPANLAILDSYQPLRNQFEHLDERLPGQERGGRLVLDVPGRMLLGLNDDGAGRITVRRDGVDVVAEVNQHGVDKIARIVAQSFVDIRTKCFEYLEAFLDDHPELTADVRWLGQKYYDRLKDDAGNYV